MEERKENSRHTSPVVITFFASVVFFFAGITLGYILSAKHHKKQLAVYAHKLQECMDTQGDKVVNCNFKGIKYDRKAITAWVMKYKRVYPRLANEVVDYVIDKSKYGLLTLAIIATESSFDAQAVSKSGAVGLMQVKPSVWKEELRKQKIITTQRDLFDPLVNIKAGEYILGKYIQQCKSVQGGLSKYLTGKCNSSVSSSYVRKVLVNLAELYVLHL